jgi:hypothetical protein
MSTYIDSWSVAALQHSVALGETADSRPHRKPDQRSRRPALKQGKQATLLSACIADRRRRGCKVPVRPQLQRRPHRKEIGHVLLLHGSAHAVATASLT